MKLVTTTGELRGRRLVESENIAAPIPYFAGTGFKHLDLSFYNIIYKDSPWISPGDAWKKEVEDCQAAAEQYGFDFCQAHSPDGEHFAEGEKRDALLLATKRSIEACSMLGIPHTVIHAGAIKGDPDRFYASNIAFYKLFEETAEKYKVDMLVENNSEKWALGYLLRSGQEMADFVKMAGIPRLHLCWDTGHANVERRDQYHDILAMGKELRALHIQDNFGDADSHLTPLIGCINFDRVMQGLLEIGYRGDFTFEADSTIRTTGRWPHYRRNVEPDDRLGFPPLHIHQMMEKVKWEIGKWMLESYGIPVE